MHIMPDQNFIKSYELIQHEADRLSDTENLMEQMLHKQKTRIVSPEWLNLTYGHTLNDLRIISIPSEKHIFYIKRMI
jgi:hypothetical protein